MLNAGSNRGVIRRMTRRPLTARSRHRANTDADRRSTQLDPLDFAFGESRLRVTSGCAGPPAAWQVNLNKRTPELERAHLAIRHPPAGRQRVRPAQLTLSDPLHGEQPTADRVVSAE